MYILSMGNGGCLCCDYGMMMRRMREGGICLILHGVFAVDINAHLSRYSFAFAFLNRIYSFVWLNVNSESPSAKGKVGMCK